MTLEEYQRKLLQLVERAAEEFNKDLPAIERKMLSKIITQLSSLETRNGIIVNNAANLKRLNVIRAEISKSIITSEYIKKVQDFIDTMDKVAALQIDYFKSIEKSFKGIGEYGRELIKQSKEAVREGLLGRGFQVEVVDSVSGILRTVVTTGGSYESLLFNVAEAMIGTSDGTTGLGRLAGYAKTLVIDSVNQFAAEYNNAIAVDLGYDWFQYIGSLVEESRPWCIAMVEKRYIHRSELPTLVAGTIDGKKVPIYEKTKLPQGMIEGTDSTNVLSRRGGHRCGHQFYPVSALTVPKEIRAKFE